MKLLLVQVPTSHLGAGEKVYPLGLSRLSSLVPSGIEKQTLDMNICLDPWARLKQVLEEQGPDMVCLSFRNLDPLAGHQASYLSSLKTAGLLARTLAPKARIMAGGPAFSLFAKRLMKEIPQIDIGLMGEGELVFEYLLSPVITPDKIPGIMWRDNGRIISNPSGPKILMDDIPELDVDSFCPNDYAKANTYVASMGIEGKRGCDLWCGYCLYPFLGGTCMRLRSPKKIVDEMMSKSQSPIFWQNKDNGISQRANDYLVELSFSLIDQALANPENLNRANLHGENINQRKEKILAKINSIHNLRNFPRFNS